MNNHIHLVAVPEEPTSMAVALRRAHSRYSAYLNVRKGRAGHLWQSRFFSCALDETHLWVALKYVERNPVRANLVAGPEEYAWSSAAAHLGLFPVAGLLDMAFAVSAGGPERWAGLLAEPEELIAVRALQRGTFTGRPVGDAAFVGALEDQLGRSLAPRQGQRRDLLGLVAGA